MIDYNKIFADSIDYVSGDFFNIPPMPYPFTAPLTDDGKWLLSCGINGLRIYAAEGGTLHQAAYDNTRPNTYWAAGNNTYVFSYNSGIGVSGYSWNGVTLTFLRTGAFGGPIITDPTDNSYIYSGNVFSRWQLYYIGGLGWRWRVDKSEDLIGPPGPLASYGMLYDAGYMWATQTGGGASPGDPLYCLSLYDTATMEVVNQYSTGYDSSASYHPYCACTDGTYIYTDNGQTGTRNRIWKFHRSGSNIIFDGSAGSSSTKTLGITWDSITQTVITQDSNTGLLKGYTPSLIQVRQTASRFLGGTSALGLAADKGYIYSTLGGISVWASADMASNRMQTIWTTP